MTNPLYDNRLSSLTDSLLKNEPHGIIICDKTAVSLSYNESKKEGKEQESIQSSTTPDLGYQSESDNFTVRHTYAYMQSF